MPLITVIPSRQDIQSSADFLIGRKHCVEKQKEQCEFFWNLVDEWKKKPKDIRAHEVKMAAFDRKIHHYDVAILMCKDKLQG
jgi:hypothetical protein